MKRLALTVGCNDYPGTGSDLAGCVNDARDWAQVFAERGFMAEILTDSRATKAAVLDRLRSYVSQLGYRDALVFQWSGHGSWIPDRDGDEPDGRDEVLCMYDYQNGGLITDDELHEVFSKVPFGARATIISDSCHSGSVHRFAAGSTVPTGDVPGVARYLPPSEFLDGEELVRARRVATTPARGLSRVGPVLLSGCTDTEYSWDAFFNGRPNGAFTRAAIDTLGARTLGGWHKATRALLPSPQFPQTPQLSATAWQRYRSPLS